MLSIKIDVPLNKVIYCAGLILGNSVGKWTEKYSRFRLSQLLDMFYSDHGVNFDPEDRSCNRETHFENLFAKNQEILQKQVHKSF